LVRQYKAYTAAMIEWLAVYDATVDRCYYVPARELGSGAASFNFATPSPEMEPAGFEPATFRVQGERSPN
jgi:hypothetical protein